VVSGRSVSVYLSVAPPDGFTRWRDSDWERWLREHPWEAAERICSRDSWAIFLYQVRAHAPSAKKGVLPVLEQLVNEKPISSQQTVDLRDSLNDCRDELDKKPAHAMKINNNNFASSEDVEIMIAAARARMGKDPSLGDVWAEVFDQLDRVIENAVAQKRGIYFGNV
jgi:hypothetical protein